MEQSALTARSDQSLVEQILRIDTGIGIPAEQIPYIYDEFYQVSVAANTTRDGYGSRMTRQFRWQPRWR
jgi:signal transduction histidine kinase